MRRRNRSRLPLLTTHTADGVRLYGWQVRSGARRLPTRVVVVAVDVVGGVGWGGVGWGGMRRRRGARRLPLGIATAVRYPVRF